MASGSASTKKKRKRVVLTIEEKVKILDMLDKSVSYSIIAEKFGIGKSTVSDLKKNKEKIRGFQREMIDMGMKSIHLYRYDGHVSHCPQ